MVTEETRKAYHNAVYKVFALPDFTFRIGKKCKNLSLLYATSGQDCAAFITAANPEGEPHDDEFNAEQNRLLRTTLESMGYELLPGVGVDPRGKWKAEESFLALGISQENALKLCAVWEQNAVVWIGPDAVPQLLFIDEED